MCINTLKKASETGHGRFNKTINLFSKGHGRVLDYGCGWGLYSQKLSEMGYDVLGIDLFQNEIDICKIAWEENDKLKFLKTSIHDLPRESFDKVLSCQVIEHVHNPGMYLYGISKELKPKGRLYFSLPNAMTLRSFFSLFRMNYFEKLRKSSEFYLESYQKQHHHINLWDPSHFVTLLASAGYKLIDYSQSEGLALLAIKFLPKYVTGPISRMKLFNNYSYTMHFVFEKVRLVEIKEYD